LQAGAGLVDLAGDAVGAVGLGDRGRLGQQRPGVVGAMVGGGDVGQPDQVGGHPRELANLPAEPGRFLQPLTGSGQVPGPVPGDAQVTERLGGRVLVGGLVRELAGAFEDRHCGLVVAADDLVEEARLGSALRTMIVPLRQSLERKGTPRPEQHTTPEQHTVMPYRWARASSTWRMMRWALADSAIAAASASSVRA
jgi:hypothetical protein